MYANIKFTPDDEHSLFSIFGDAYYIASNKDYIIIIILVLQRADAFEIKFKCAILFIMYFLPVDIQ